MPKPRQNRKRKNRKAASPAAAVPVEADLESRVAGVLRTALPNIPPHQLRHQHCFTVRVGRHVHEIDGAEDWKANGRSDILIQYRDRPLAVLEIKRENVALKDEDYQQAQSYANQLTPRPPLVIVTNGQETRLYDGNTGQAWSAGDDAAAAVAQLFVNAAKVASADLRWAIEALMGRDKDLWTRVVRASTTALIDEMTDPPGLTGRPFARDFQFPRLATLEAATRLEAGPIFTIIEGPPLTGKTNVLRELAQRTADGPKLAVLMLRGAGSGLFQAIANLFAAELQWNLTAADARAWLRNISVGAAGPALVLAADAVEPGTAMAAGLEELPSLSLGNKVRVILTTDQTEGLVTAPNGRTKTALGANATRIELGPLGLRDFEFARHTLAGARILFPRGAEYAEDYRAAWVLRALYDNVAHHPLYPDPAFKALFPPSLGLELVDATRETYAGQTDLLRGYRLLARDALADAKARSGDLSLAGSDEFIIRQDALSGETRDCLHGLRARGWVRVRRHAGREDVVVPTVPAAFLVEFADAAGDELGRRAATDPHDAGVWLGQRLDAVHLGDLVGAQAIKSLADKDGGFSSGIIDGLLSIQPKEDFVENALIAMATADGRVVHLKIQGGKAYRADRAGNVSGEPIELEAERSRLYADTTAWMILGQFARLPTALDGDDSRRVDAGVLLRIGQCRFPLLRTNPDGLGHFTHDLGALGEVVCQDHGPLEPTTQAMAALLSRPWADADAWVDRALASGSVPLVYRLMIALRTVAALDIPERSVWAHALVQDRVGPAVAAAIRDRRRANRPPPRDAPRG